MSKEKSKKKKRIRQEERFLQLLFLKIQLRFGLCCKEDSQGHRNQREEEGAVSSAANREEDPAQQTLLVCASLQQMEAQTVRRGVSTSRRPKNSPMPPEFSYVLLRPCACETAAAAVRNPTTIKHVEEGRRGGSHIPCSLHVTRQSIAIRTGWNKPPTK